MGLFERLNFLLVFIVLGVEGINYLGMEEKELDQRIRRGWKALINCFEIGSIIQQWRLELRRGFGLRAAQDQYRYLHERRGNRFGTLNILGILCGTAWGFRTWIETHHFFWSVLHVFCLNRQTKARVTAKCSFYLTWPKRLQRDSRLQCPNVIYASQNRLKKS